MKGFVSGLYACDTVPFRHLVLKTKYLLKLKPEIGFVLVENAEPDEQMVGQGAFRHIQCMKVNAVKSEIRRRFNKGEEHVVHASDYETQTQHALKLLGIRKKPPTRRGTIRTANLSDLRASIIDVGLVVIEDTPHFGYVTGDKDAYRDYYERYWGTRLTDDHAPEAFDNLIGAAAYNRIRVNGDTIIDGVHRAAILKRRGTPNVKVEDISI